MPARAGAKISQEALQRCHQICELPVKRGQRAKKEVATSSVQDCLEGQQIREILQDWHQNGQKDLFEEGTSSLRRVIESIDPEKLGDEISGVFQYFNDIARFKCPRPHCHQFSLGFLDRKTRDAHIDEHLRPFKCPNEECYARLIGFPSQSELDTHVRRLHNIIQPIFPPSARKPTDIFSACRRGDFDAVKILVSQGVDINMSSQPKGQMTPIVLAAKRGNVLVCQYLVQHGAQVYVSRSSGGTVTALGEAIERRDYDTFRILVETAGEHEKQAFLGRSTIPNLGHYIQVAVASGAVEILKDILSWSEQISYPTIETIFDSKCNWENNEAIAHTLLSRMRTEDINDINKFGETPLHEAARRGNSNRLRLLLEAGANANLEDRNGRLPIDYACANSDTRFDSILRSLLSYINDVDRQDSGETMLHRLVKHGRTEAIVSVLEENPSSVDARDTRGDTPLWLALKRLDKTVVGMLLDTGKVDVDSKDNTGYTPLSWATANGNEAAVKLLLDTGKVNVDLKDNTGYPPLSWTTANGHEAIVKLLLDTGKATIDVKDKDEQTPMFYAAKCGYEAIVKLLLDTGNVDINIKDQNGWTPIMWAVANGHEAVVKLLLDIGNVNINFKDKNGQGPLFRAAANGNEAILKLLLDTSNININLEDENG